MSLDPALCLQVPGRLVSNPTFASRTVFPFGGTALGIKSKAFFVREEVVAWRHSEGRGRDKVKGYRGRVAGAFLFTLVEYDTAVLDKLWAFTTTSGGGFAGANTLRLPQLGGTLQPGAIAADSPLLFAADDPAHPSTLIHAPIWTPGARQQLALALNVPLESVIVVGVGLDANNLDVSIDRLEHLSLT